MSRSDASVRDRLRAGRAAIADAWATTKRVLTVLVGLGAVAVWTAFWGIVIRLHYLKGNYLDATVTAFVFVLPVVVMGGYYLRGVGDLVGRPILPSGSSEGVSD